jgi:4-hydroxy-tetrahydrodipicolinate reductase
MIKIISSGCGGRMGLAFARVAEADPDVEIVAGVRRKLEKTGDFPIYLDPMEFGGAADVLVDFSSPDALDPLLRWASERRRPLVLCATGYSREQLDKIRALSAAAPVFRSGNMSLGINLVAELIARAAAALGAGFDVEIVERHHRRKLDAPSGTAIMLADAVNGARSRPAPLVFDRSVRRASRSDEIGVSAIRGGTIVGEHEVIFAGADEVIEIKHTAYSRDIFASGACRAAKFMAAVKAPGLYDMSDVISN